MAVVMPDVVVISSDDDEDSDAEGNFVTEAVKPDLVIISSDDDDGDIERNLVEGLVSEQDADYSQLDYHESDKEEANAVEKSNVEECIDKCNERCDGSGSSNQGGNDLHALCLYECKTYLRKHGMRVSGTEEECIQRIEEHERLKNERAESLYPRSSFSINCTGDACRGDVLLFKQNIYNGPRKIIGRRTVAGRIANESYGAKSPLHTFSVEVLWSEPIKQLDPPNILLVNGCNLYRFGTYRQPWENEAERLKVLEEKHERGSAARCKRKLRETEFASGDNKGTKRRKVFHKVQSQSKHVNGLYKHTNVNENTTAHNQAVLFQSEELKGSTQLTYHHPDPNRSMHSDHHIQEASLPFSNDTTLLPNNLLPFGSSGCSHYNNEQQGPSRTSQSPDHLDHKSEPPVHRSKYEKAKLHFPESSFSINCTGDARERDFVLFKQVFLAGKNAKKISVAGRIVKVRQCGSRDKHRFKIKVLWTIPFIENLRGSTLLVKSHNLYKFGTFRQPWKNEAMRSQMFEEKHKPASLKRKLKKTDIALNKKKGGKRQKVSHDGASSSKQQTQVANCKYLKRKGASATPKKKKKDQKMKMKKLKQTFHQNPNPSSSSNPNPNPGMNLNPSQIINPNVNPNSDQTSSITPNPNLILSIIPNLISSTTSNPNPMSSTTSNPISNTTSNPNPISSTTSNPNSKPSPHQNLDPNPKSNPSEHQNGKPNARQNRKPNARRNGKANARQNGQPNARQSQNLNARQNGKPEARQSQNLNACQNGKRNARLDPNALQIGTNSRQSLDLKARQNGQPNARQNQNLNARQKEKLEARQSQNLNACQNGKPNTCLDPNALQIGTNSCQSPDLKARQNGQPNARQRQNLNARQNGKPEARQSQNLNACQNGKPYARLDPNVLQIGTNFGQSPDLKARQNGKSNPRQSLNPNACQSQNPNAHQNQNLILRQNRNLNALQNQDKSRRHNWDPITSQNPDPNPYQYPNSLVYGGQQVQEWSLSLPYDRSFIPPPVWFVPNQPPGYGGRQWGPIQPPPPDYNYMAAQLLLHSLFYHQPPL